MLPSGKVKWLAAYSDNVGQRRFKQFDTRKEADVFMVRVRSEVAAGSHVPDRAASTVDQAYALLIAALEADQAARATLHNYRVYYLGHVKPYLGTRLLPKLHPADVGDWLERLKADGRTDDTRRRARIVLGAIFDEAIRRRLAHANPVRSLRSRRKTRRAEIREVEETIRIPEREVVRAMLAAAADTDALFLIARERGGEVASIIEVQRVSADHPIRAVRAFRTRHPGAEVETFRPTSWLRPLLATMALAGLRIGEARGLSWASVEPEHLKVREGVDRYNVRDTVKTAAALRSVPIGPQLATILANWQAGTTGDGDLVFPSEKGTPIGYPNIVNRQLGPLQIALGIVAADGSPRWTAHSFRHFAVSLWIDEGAKIGQVSEWAGHESPEFTQRVYGHLFRAGRTDRRAVTAGELSVLGAIEPATSTQHGNDNALKNSASATA
ncbi:site-specific integrase [Methylobacterium sp. NEAU K]|uniref:tyrosine-type recombinase/integrase n=1 Tax=Methylobacterium sp. NEAU K TaxID=3064946 RepID=UPI002732AC75|nr:site-specific integrase [Methylobacterium sp. NEAU K]MDP4006400.1 site-specific integrase [Methylobacterium sp. NEAU K]